MKIQKTNTAYIAIITNEGATEINRLHEQAMESLISGLQHAVKYGEILIKIKKELERKEEEWLVWVIQNCDYPHEMADRYIKLAKYVHRHPMDNAKVIRHALEILNYPKLDKEK